MIEDITLVVLGGSLMGGGLIEAIHGKGGQQGKGGGLGSEHLPTENEKELDKLEKG